MSFQGLKSSLLGDIVLFQDVVRSPLADYSRKHLVVQSLNDLMFLPVGVVAFASWSFASASVLNPNSNLYSFGLDTISEDHGRLVADFETFANVIYGIEDLADVRSQVSVYIQDFQIDSFFASSEDYPFLDEVYIELTESSVSPQGGLPSSIGFFSRKINDLKINEVSVKFVIPEGSDLKIEVPQVREIVELSMEFIPLQDARIRLVVEDEEALTFDEVSLIADLPSTVSVLVENPKQVLNLRLGADVNAEISAWARAAVKMSFNSVDQMHFIAGAGEDLQFTPTLFGDLTRLSKLTEVSFDMDLAGSVSMISSSVEEVGRILSSSYRMAFMNKLAVSSIEIASGGLELPTLTLTPRTLVALGEITVEGAHLELSLPSFDALSSLLKSSQSPALGRIDTFVLDSAKGIESFDFRLLDDLKVSLRSHGEDVGVLRVPVPSITDFSIASILLELDRVGVKEIDFDSSVEIGAAEMLAISRTDITFAPEHSVQAAVGISLLAKALDVGPVRRPDQLIADDFWLAGVDQIKVFDDQGLGDVELAFVIEAWLEKSEEYSGQTFDESFIFFDGRGSSAHTPLQEGNGIPLSDSDGFGLVFL